MFTSTSDHEMSECSNSASSYTGDSSHSSPSQQVPQLATTLTVFTCADNIVNDGNSPFLRIIEQPQKYFRFRYDTEKTGSSGTHGCLLGKSSTTNKNVKKTHPTVELVNYSGQALIRCCLKHHCNTEKDLYKLLEDKQKREYSFIVPKCGSYKVGFSGIGIHTTKKEDLSNLLYRKFSEQNTSYNALELQEQCKKISKTMNLNVVRLKFSAHDVATGKEICSPVYSDLIHNKKNVMTSDLKICRMSMFSGKPGGGDDVFIFVEKVDKNNIKIRFFEEDENKERVWSAMADFLPNHVHYQYGIVFSTPAYRDPQTAVDVKVYIELVRPSDGRTSEPKEFLYKADAVTKQMKKHQDIPNSSPGGSHTSEISTPVIDNLDSSVSEWGLSSAVDTVVNAEAHQAQCSQPSAAAPSQLQLDSAESIYITQEVAVEDTQITKADFEREYIEVLLGDIEEMKDSESILASLISDSGRAKVETSTSSHRSSSKAAGQSGTSGSDRTKGKSEYPAFYKPDDASEVKKLLRELCEILRKKGDNKEVRSKLERLFDIRLSNGDTFLHMTLFRNQPSFQSIVKIIHNVKMSRLLNYANCNKETTLHLAVIMGLPSIASLLVSKGCDPMLTNKDEENAIHLAVRYNPACLQPLLDTITKHEVPCDLNARNKEKQSALHLCALHNAASCAAQLVARGASYSVRDAAGRTPLHLCAYDARPHVARAILHAVRACDVDAVDGRGNTALQIVCGRAMDDCTLEMAAMLLDKQADPLRHEQHAESAWRLSRDKPALRAALRCHVPPGTAAEDDVKSEPDDADEYESAEDDCTDETTLESLALKLKDTGLFDTSNIIKSHIE